MAHSEFQLAGAELAWPIGAAPGLTNHPTVESTANRLAVIAGSGVSFVVGGSWKLGEASGGNGYVQQPNGMWIYNGGDEHLDLAGRAGYNAKGLPGIGTDLGMAHLDDFMDIAASKGVELGLSLSPHTGRPLEELKELLEIARVALNRDVLFVEINLSCPNVPDRPPFYKDNEGVIAFYEYLATLNPLLNRYGHPGIYPKYGPFNPEEYPPDIHVGQISSIGGKVTSNKLGNQEPKLSNEENAILVNGGKAGMSGPALEELGRQQLELHASVQRYGENISVLGISTGAEVNKRLSMGATAVELGSVLYWPELIGCETPAQAVRQIKEEMLADLGAA